MKKITLASIIISSVFVANAVYADVELVSKEQVAGNWKLEYTKMNATTTKKIPREDTWLLKGGEVTISHIPLNGRDKGKYYDQPALTYRIEEGKLLIPYLGRGGGDLYAVVDINDQTMTLKGKYGDYFYFKKIAE
jgi:hypothetical protein